MRAVRARPIGWLVFGAAAAVFAWLAPGGVGLGDAGEIGAAAHVLGVAHPTGFPVDTMVLHAANLVPLGPLAFRQNLLVALAAAGCLALLALVVRDVAQQAGALPSAAEAAGLLAPVAFGSWATFFDAAVAVETHVGALLVGLGGVWAVLQPRPRLTLLALLAGLSLGVHVTARVAMLPILAAAWVRVPTPRWREGLPRLVGAFLLGALTTAYTAIASAGDPPLDWGDPETAARWWEHLVASNYVAARGGLATLGPWHLRRLGGQLWELWPLFLPAAIGLPWWLRRWPGGALAALGVLVVDLAYALLVNPGGIATREVGHVAGAVLVVFAGAGIAGLLETIGDRRLLRLLGRVATAALAAACVFVGAGSAHLDPHAADGLYGSAGMLGALPPRAVVLCASREGCGSAWFAQHAEGSRPDVVVVRLESLWEPAARDRLRARVPELARWDGVRPDLTERRAALVRDVVRALPFSAGARPLFFERPDVARAADLPLRASTIPPLAVPRGAPFSAEGPAPLGLLDARRTRMGFELHSPGARTVWSEAYETVGDIALGNRGLPLALLAYRRAADVMPERAGAWAKLGQAHAHLGEFDRAVEAARRAVDLEPGRPEPWRTLAGYLATRGEFDEARDVVRAARHQGIRDPELEALDARLPR